MSETTSRAAHQFAKAPGSKRSMAEIGTPSSPLTTLPPQKMAVGSASPMFQAMMEHKFGKKKPKCNFEPLSPATLSLINDIDGKSNRARAINIKKEGETDEEEEIVAMSLDFEETLRMLSDLPDPLHEDSLEKLKVEHEDVDFKGHPIFAGGDEDLTHGIIIGDLLGEEIPWLEDGIHSTHVSDVAGLSSTSSASSAAISRTLHPGGASSSSLRNVTSSPRLPFSVASIDVVEHSRLLTQSVKRASFSDHPSEEEEQPPPLYHVSDLQAQSTVANGSSRINGINSIGGNSSGGSSSSSNVAGASVTAGLSPTSSVNAVAAATLAKTAATVLGSIGGSPLSGSPGSMGLAGSGNASLLGNHIGASASAAGGIQVETAIPELRMSLQPGADVSLWDAHASVRQGAGAHGTTDPHLLHAFLDGDGLTAMGSMSMSPPSHSLFLSLGLEGVPMKSEPFGDSHDSLILDHLIDSLPIGSSSDGSNYSSDTGNLLRHKMKPRRASTGGAMGIGGSISAPTSPKSAAAASGQVIKTSGQYVGMSTRDAHNAMERERRVGLRSSFDRLRQEIPRLQAGRAPSLQILQEAANYIKSLRDEDARIEAEVKHLRMMNTAMRERMNLPVDPIPEASETTPLAATAATSISSTSSAPSMTASVITTAGGVGLSGIPYQHQASSPSAPLLASSVDLLTHETSLALGLSVPDFHDPLLASANALSNASTHTALGLTSAPTTTLSSIEKFLAEEI